MNFPLSQSDLLFDEGPLTLVKTLVKERSGDVAGRIAICIQSNFKLDIRYKYLPSPAISIVNLYEGTPIIVETLVKKNRGVGVSSGGMWVASCI
jgi:hypothetical protein